MLYGIISDIHSNLEALTSVLENLKAVDQVVSLGDIVGYGPSPNECVEKIIELKIPSVAGNHDKAVINAIDTKWFNPRAMAAVYWTQRVIFQENLEYLKSLPPVLEPDNFYCVHGSLREPCSEYVLSVADAIPTFELMQKPLCFVGHTHRPMFIAKKFDGNYAGGDLRDGDEVLADNYEKVIINAGAVGQPRDDDPRAGFGIYNSKTRIFSMHRVKYNIESVQNRMRDVKLPPQLIERLGLGR